MSGAESRRTAVASAIRRERLVAIIRSDSARRARDAAEVLLASGIAILEIALTTPGALVLVRELVDEVPEGVHVGVGTAVTAWDVRESARAGASFAVSPTTDVKAVRAAHDADMFSLPGAATPTEIVTAVSVGADMVKLFPASLWGLESFRHLRAPLPDVELVPSGGIAIHEVPDWLAAGAVAVGVGSSLTAGSEQDVKDRVRRLRNLAS